MLKTENRLKLSADFSRVMKEGHRLAGPFLMIASSPNTKKQLCLGVVVSKKVDKRAVNRNRLRRIVSHLFEHIQRDSNPAFDVVVLVKRRPEQTAFQVLEQEVHAWQKKFLSS